MTKQITLAMLLIVITTTNNVSTITFQIVKEHSDSLIRTKNTQSFALNTFSYEQKLVELSRIELLTSCVQGRRSPS